jgi:hypothetical protein
MSSVRLWTFDGYILAAEHQCPPPVRAAGDVVVEVPGGGAIYAAVRELLAGPIADENIYLTVDLADHEYYGGPRRVGGVVTKLEVERRRCECGVGTITTTTVRSAGPCPMI